MSNPEVGEAYVKIRPLVGDDFPQQIGKQVDQGLKQAQAAADRIIGETSKRIEDLSLRAQAATLRGDDLSASRFQAQSQLEQVIFAAQQARTQAAEMVSSDQAAMRELLLASADAYDKAAEKLRGMIAKSQQTGRPVQVGGGGVGGVLDTLERVGGQRSTGVGGLLGGFGRLGVAGLVGVAAFQALGEFSKALRVTGDEAFTTQGRIRNLGAELVSGNIVGGLKALTASQPAKIMSDLAAEIEKVKQKNDPLVVSEQDLLDARSKGRAELELYVRTLEITGHINDSTADAMIKVGEQLHNQERLARATADALDNYATKVREAGSEAAAFGPDSRGGAQGVGAITAANAALAAQGGPTPPAGTGGRDVANQIRESIISRIKDDVERTKLEVQNARIIQAQKRATFENVKGTSEGAKAWLDYVQATTQVTNAVNAAKVAARTAATASQELANQVRESAVQTIADPAAAAQAELRNAKIRENQAREAFEATTKGTKEANQAWAAYQIAINERKGIEVQIAKDQREAAKTAAEEAQAARDRHQSAVEQSLENQIAKAALTKRKTDDEAAFAAAISYWKSVAKNAKDDSAREDAEAKVIALRKRRQEFRSGGAGATGEDLALLKIQNDILAARLTPGIEDDKKRAKILVDYWREKMKIAVGDAEAFQKARTEWLQARLNLQGLTRSASEESPDVFVNRLFTEAADQFRRFGSNFTTSRSGMLASQDARGELASILLGGRDNAAATAQRTRDAQLEESRKQTSWLQIIANGPRRRVTGTPVSPEVGQRVAEIGGLVLRGL